MAAALDLDADAFDVCVTERRFRDLVEKDLNDGQAAGVYGTPAFFVNGIPLSGARSLDDFVQLIDQELARGGRPPRRSPRGAFAPFARQAPAASIRATSRSRSRAMRTGSLASRFKSHDGLRVRRAQVEPPVGVAHEEPVEVRDAPLRRCSASICAERAGRRPATRRLISPLAE